MYCALRTVVTACAIGISGIAGIVPGAQAAFTTASTVTYNNLGQRNLTVTPTGPTTFDVLGGHSFTIAGTWGSVPTGNICAGCETQLYIAGISPLDGQIDLVDNGVIFATLSGSYSQ